MKGVEFSFKRLGILATMTFRELLHQKVSALFALLFFLFLAVGSLLVAVSFQEKTLLFQEMFLSLFSLFLNLLAIVASAPLLTFSGEEVMILARAVPRFEYFLGKLLGVLLLLFMASSYFGVISLLSQSFWSIILVGPLFFIALLGAFMKAALLAAMTLLISTIASSSLFAIVASLAFYVMGHIEAAAQQLCTRLALVHGWTEHVLQMLLYLVPDLSLFNMSEHEGVSITECISYFLEMMKLGSLYFGIYVFLGCFLFERRESANA
ncbi:MAG: hypothetical protein ACOYK6_00220 [Chthoniobacterales bacterium]